jgi:hypothetical protein
MMKDFEIDRTDVPTFYTVVNVDTCHRMPLGTVLAESSDHFKPGWLTLGYVSRESPFGQGTYCGFAKEEVRVATKEGVLKAICLDHPHGIGFRPGNMEAMDANFQLVMASALGNWTSNSQISF